MLLLFFIFQITFLSLPSPIFTDLAADKSALLTLRSAVGGRTSQWNAADPTPCNWAGVHCDNDHVTALHLPGVSLTGPLPYGVFPNLTKLRTLSLRFNALSGRLPPDLSACTELRNLYLKGNRFSGPLPDFLFRLKDLVRLNLAGNLFDGEISTGFNGLTRLKTLYLENNRFNGSVPDLSKLLPNLAQFNVSNNLLNGSIPKSLQSMPVTSFVGNSLCGPPLKNPCPSGNDRDNSNGNSSKEDDDNGGGLSNGAIAGIVIGTVIGFLLFVLVVLVLCRKRRGKKTSSVDVAAIKYNQETDDDLEKGGGSVGGFGASNGVSSVAAVAAAAMTGNGKGEGADGGNNGVKKLVFFGYNVGRDAPFDIEDLYRASAEIAGKGTFGTTYKAALDAGMVVAVKRLKDVTISEREFREKIELVGAMVHEKLVPLRAYCYSKDEKLLVYDYMSMGSLSALLHGNRGAGRPPLNWELRSTIALGAARGIEYLHSRGPNISHGNIKSSNILLTQSTDARVADFCLAHLVGPSTSASRVAGYRAPEVTDPRKVSQKADVYSFGVLLLELLTGKAPTHALLNEEGVDLPRWVQSVINEERTSEVFDLELLRYQNVEEEMVQLLQLALDCADQYPDKRPSMIDVRKRIEVLCRLNVDDVVPNTDVVDKAN